MPKPKPPGPSGGTVADYFDRFLPGPEEPTRAPAPSRQARPARQASPAREPRQVQRQARPGRRQRTTLYLDQAQFAEARRAATLLGASGLEPGTVSAIFDGALERELERLRKLHNGGQPFPALPTLPGNRRRSD